MDNDLRKVWWRKDGTCTISEGVSWLPGMYATPQAALLAFEVDDFRPLLQLDRIITEQDVIAHVQRERGNMEPVVAEPAWSYADEE